MKPVWGDILNGLADYPPEIRDSIRPAYTAIHKAETWASQSTNAAQVALYGFTAVCCLLVGIFGEVHRIRRELVQERPQRRTKR